MFYYCSSLTSINLSHFNTKEVLSMRYIFYFCHNLAYIDISYFYIKIDSYIDNGDLFYGLPDFGAIKLNKESKDSISRIPSGWSKIIIN